MLARSCIMTSLVCENYECVVFSFITQKKRLIQNLIYLKSPTPSVTGFYLQVYIICTTDSACVRACVRACV